MDIASGLHWSKPADFKGGAEGNLISQARFISAHSFLPLHLFPSLCVFNCLDLPPRLDQRCFSAFQSPPPFYNSNHVNHSYLRQFDPHWRWRNKMKIQLSCLPLTVNRFALFMKNEETAEWERRWRRVVDRPDYWQAFIGRIRWKIPSYHQRSQDKSFFFNPRIHSTAVPWITGRSPGLLICV